MCEPGPASSCLTYQQTTGQQTPCFKTGQQTSAVSHSRTSSSGSGDGVLLSVANLASRGKKNSSRPKTEQDNVSLRSGGSSQEYNVRSSGPSQKCCQQSDLSDNSLSSELSLDPVTNGDVHEYVRVPNGDVIDDLAMGQGESMEGGDDKLRNDPEGLDEHDGTSYASFLSVDKRLFARLQEELRLKEEEVGRLSRIRDDVEAELEELTASLFQEAHRMVREANVKAAQAEKSLAESDMKIDGLETEVAALKTLVITSTPAMPNKHLHPHIDPKNGRGKGATSAPGSPAKERSSDSNCNDTPDPPPPERHFDPVIRQEYNLWKKSPTMDKNQAFLARIYREDIVPCLTFPNTKLSESVLSAVSSNTLSITPVTDLDSQQVDCSLLQVPRRCRHVVRLAEAEDEFPVGALARNRIAAVCDFITYCRYVTQGLVKSHTNDVYWELMERRKQMALARLGFST